MIGIIDSGIGGKGIEAEKNQPQKYTPGVVAIWSKYKDKNIDTIVLGCTHYTLIKDDIQKIVGNKIKIIDSNLAVAKQVEKVYNEIKR